MTITFDVDGCLIDNKGEYIEANIAILKILTKTHKVYITSGNGWQYALEKTKDLSTLVSGYVDKYGGFTADIHFDDKEVKIGKINICVT
jgi:hydroxymethylpyrimidine pyrophosphatase-like HAD family hydrolase